MNNNIKVFGNITLREFYIVSQDTQIELNEYFILEDNNNSTPVEVVEVFTAPVCMPGMLPIDVPNVFKKARIVRR